MLKENVYTKEKWMSVNKKNKSLLEDFLLEMKSNKKSPSSIQQYRCDMKMIYCHMLDEFDNAYILDLKKKDFRRIKMWLLEEREVSAARCNRVMSVIHSLLDFAEDDEDYEYEFNLSKKVKGVSKESVREIIFLTDEQITRLRDELKERQMYKHMCLLDLLYDSAGRRSEVWQIKREGLLERNYTNIVRGKGGKQFPLVYFYRSKESLKLYLDTRTDDLEELWVTSRYEEVRPCAKETLYEYIRNMRIVLAELEGRYIKINVHSFRHSSLENMKNGTHYMCQKLGKENGFSLEELKIYAHHEDTSTTEGYLKKNDNNVLENMFGIKIA